MDYSQCKNSFSIYPSTSPSTSILPFFSVQVGDVFTGFISFHIKDSNEFFVFSKDDDWQLGLSRGYKKDVMWWLPAVGEKFLVTNDGPECEKEGFMRCVRLPLDSATRMKISMIDLGEEYTISVKELPYNNMLVMPEQFNDIPPLAIKCRGHKIFDEIDDPFDPSAFLASIVYRKYTFEVVAVEEDLIVVDILPFDSSQSWDEEQAVEEIKQFAAEEAVPRFPVTNDLVATKDTMAPREREIWEEETPNTSNPQIALQGFQTKDDDRLCKFYDPEIGGCWKGGRCKLRHRKELTDGTLRDTAEFHSDRIEEELPLPRLHSMIKFKVTGMISNNRFWCLYDGPNKAKSERDLEMLTNFMNQEEEVETYTKLKSVPHIKQLVLYKSKDGTFFRGSVVSFVDEDCVQVLLVDKGILVDVVQHKCLYHWNPRLNFLAFQAVEIEIANIKYDENIDKSKILPHLQNPDGSPLRGFVLDVCGLKCTLRDWEDNDIGEKLVELGLAEAKKPFPPTINTFGIPG